MSLDLKAASVFLKLCAVHSTKKPNSQILSFFTEGNTESWVRTLSWDFTSNLLGKATLRAVLDMAMLHSGLRHMSFSHNQLDTDSVAHILLTMTRHKGLTSVDLSHNPMSVVSARALHATLQRCPHITDVNLEGTGVDSGDWIARINRELALNTKRKPLLSTARQSNAHGIQWSVEAIRFLTCGGGLVSPALLTEAYTAVSHLNDIGREKCNKCVLVTPSEDGCNTTTRIVIIVGNEDLSDAVKRAIATSSQQQSIFLYAEKTSMVREDLASVMTKPNVTFFEYSDADMLILRLQSDLWSVVFESTVIDRVPPSTNRVLWQRHQIHLLRVEQTYAFGRELEVSDVTGYCVKTGAITVPLVVYGASGIGGSSILAMSAKKLLSHEGIRVIPFFFGCGTDTSMIASFVFDVLFSMLGPEDFNELMTKTSQGDLVAALYQTLQNWDKISKTRTTTVLLVGGLDRVEVPKIHSYSCAVTAWLPAVLPPNLRVVVSFNTSDASLQHLRRRKPLPLELRVANLTPRQSLSTLQAFLQSRNVPMPSSLQLGLSDPFHFDVHEGIVQNPTSPARAFVGRQDCHLPLYLELVAAALSLPDHHDGILETLPGSIEGVAEILMKKTEDMFGVELVRYVSCMLCATNGSDATALELCSVVQAQLSVPLGVIGSFLLTMKSLGLVKFTAEACVAWSHSAVRAAVVAYYGVTETDVDTACIALALCYAPHLAPKTPPIALSRALIRLPICLIRSRQITSVLSHIASIPILQCTMDQGLLWNFLNMVFALKQDTDYLREIGLESMSCHQYSKCHSSLRVEVTFNDLMHSCQDIALGTSLLQVCVLLTPSSLLNTAALEYLAHRKKQPTTDASVPILLWTNRKEGDRLSRHTWTVPTPLIHCDVSKDGVLVVLTTQRTATVFSINDKTKIACFESPTDDPLLASYFINDTPHTPTLAVSILSNAIIMWDVATAHIVATFEGYTASLRRQAISTNGKRMLAVNVVEKQATVLDLVERKPLSTLPSPNDEDIREVHFALHVEVALVVSTYDAYVHRTGVDVVTLQQDELITRACICNDGTFVVLVCGEKIYLWKAMSGVRLYKMCGHSVAVNDVVFNPTGQVLLSCSPDGKLIVWSVMNGEVLKELHCGLRKNSTSPLNPQYACYSADGARIVARCDNVLRVFDSTSWMDLGVSIGHTSAITYLTLTRADSVITVDGSGTAKLWSFMTALPSFTAYSERHYLTTNNLCLHSNAHAVPIVRVVLANNMIATLTENHEVTLWPTNSAVGSTPVYLKGIVFAWAPPSGKFIMCSTVTEITVFDHACETPIRAVTLLHDRSFQGNVTGMVHLTLYEDMIACVLGSTTLSNRIVVFNFQTLELVTQLTAHTKDVTGLQFINSETIVSSSLDGSLRTWGLKTHTQWSQWEGMEGISAVAGYANILITSYVEANVLQLVTVVGRNTIGGPTCELPSKAKAMALAHERLLIVCCADNVIRLCSIMQSVVRIVSVIRAPFGVGTCVSSRTDAETGDSRVAVGDSHGHCLLYDVRLVS